MSFSFVLVYYVDNLDLKQVIKDPILKHRIGILFKK